MPSPTFDPELILADTGWLRRFARSLVADQDTAEDLSQDAVLAALQRPPDSSRALRSWLRQVVRRRAVERSRAEASRVRRELEVARVDRRTTGADSTADVLERMEAQRTVVGELLELEAIYRDALALRFFDDLSYDEISARLGVPLETVRTRIRRGLAQLRERMDRRYGDRRVWALLLLGGDPLPAPLTRSSWRRTPMLAGLLALLLVLGLVSSHALSAGPGPESIELVVLRWPFRCGLSDPAVLVSRQVAAEFDGRVTLIEQDFCSSALAREHGLLAYPAVFVAGELVARPEDFFAWGGASGRFQPWTNAGSRDRFADILRDRVAAGLASGAARSEPPADGEPDPQPDPQPGSQPGSESDDETLAEGAAREPLVAPREEPAVALHAGIERLLQDVEAAGSAESAQQAAAELRTLQARCRDGAWLGTLLALLEEVPALAGVPTRDREAWPVSSSGPMSLAEFDRQWAEARRMVAASVAEIRADLSAAAVDVPVAVRALAEVRMFEAGPNLRAARPYARSTTPVAGARYVERARRLLRAARLCTTLRAERRFDDPDPDAVAAEHAALAHEVDERFAVATVGSDIEFALLGAHAACNLARGMLAAGYVVGAHLTILEARVDLRETLLTEVPTPGVLRRLLATARTIRGGPFAPFRPAYLELADILARRGTEDDRKRARAICEALVVGRQG